MVRMLGVVEVGGVVAVGTQHHELPPPPPRPSKVTRKMGTPRSN
jgi:hypothetical protein